MPMLTYAAKESPIGVATDTCDMYLVVAAKDGDHQAYAELCRRHSKQILRTVLRITRNIADAEDMRRAVRACAGSPTIAFTGSVAEGIHSHRRI